MKYLYVFAYIVAIIIIYTMYFKYKNRFWSTQPVFFYHQLWNWIFPKGLVYPLEIPLHKNKYYDHFRVKTLILNNSKIENNDFELELLRGFSLIQQHYLRETDMIYQPKTDDILVYLKGHNSPCFYSYYYTNNLLLDINSQTQYNMDKNYIQNQQISSCLISRPLNVCLDGNRFITNYVDFLTTHKKERKKGITPRLINTFAYQSNQYYLKNEKNIHSSYLFKNEAHKIGIVPFIAFQSYFCSIKYFSPKDFNPLVKLTLITENNLNLFTQNAVDIFSEFEHYIYSDIGNLESLIREKQLYIFCSQQKQDILDWYFFRKSHVFYKNEAVWECIGSYSKFYSTYKQDTSIIKIKYNINSNEQNEAKQLFISHFYNCIDYLKKNEQMRYINIENLSHNNVFLSSIIQKKLYISSTPYHYYFYNFVYHPQKSNEVFILC